MVLLLLSVFTNGANWEFTIVEILLYMCTVLIDKVGRHQRVVLGTHDYHTVILLMDTSAINTVLNYHTTVYI